jgi:hypothetical protein
LFALKLEDFRQTSENFPSSFVPIFVFATVQKIRSSLAEWHIGSLGSES